MTSHRPYLTRQRQEILHLLTITMITPHILAFAGISKNLRCAQKLLRNLRKAGLIANYTYKTAKGSHGAEFRFTDKTAVFTIPFTEFTDIPQKTATLEPPGFLEVAFILPEYAHERKRFFRKNGTVGEFAIYLNHLGVELSEKQLKFLNDLAVNRALRLYHEILELPDRNEIRGYFVNIPKNYEAYSPSWIRKCIRDRLSQEELLVVRRVTQFSTWYPEWMRKIGGIIVEAKSGTVVSIPKPLQIGVDVKLPEYSVKREPLFIPSARLMNEAVPAEEWQAMFIAEMRATYKTNHQEFRKYASDLAQKRIELRCSCNDHGTHKPKCPVPVLENIFAKLRESGKTGVPTPPT